MGLFSIKTTTLPYVNKKTGSLGTGFSFSRGRTRTYGLQVMSLASCQLLHPAANALLAYDIIQKVSTRPWFLVYVCHFDAFLRGFGRLGRFDSIWEGLGLEGCFVVFLAICCSV